MLQAATRCLRQVPGNARKARIYLSQENRAVLDRQLHETYGETIADLDRSVRELRSARLVLRKVQPAARHADEARQDGRARRGGPTLR